MVRIAESILAVLKGRLALRWSPAETSILFFRFEGVDLMSLLLTPDSYSILDWRVGSFSLKALILAIIARPQGKGVSASYVAHFVRLTRCKAVMSFMDQTGALANAKLLEPNVTTIAFQNGIPPERFETAAMAGQIVPADITFGFGTPPPGAIAGGERRFILTGSLKANLVPVNRTRHQESVLFVSQWRSALEQTDFYTPERVLLPSLSKWCREHHLTLTILGSSSENPLDERRFFTDICDTRGFLWVPKDGNDFSNAYDEVDKAGLVVAVNSSLGIEAMFRGKQVYFFSDGHPKRRFHKIAAEKKRGPYWVSDGNVAKFCSLLGEALALGNQRSDRLSSAALGEEWDPDPGLVKTRKKILGLRPDLSTEFVHPGTPVFFGEDRPKY